MASTELTNATVQQAQATDQPHIIWDTKLTGFGLKTTPTGIKTFILQYRVGGQTRRATIGRTPLTLQAARTEAKRRLDLLKAGQDPAHVKMGFRSYARFFIKRHVATNKSCDATTRLIERDLIPTFGNTPLDRIHRPSVAQLMDNLYARAPSAERHAFAALRTLFNFAVNRGDIKISPMQGMKAPAPPGPRDRVLDEVELKATWNACEDLGYPFGTIYQLLLVTGQRRSEIAGMRWSEISGDVWTIPGTRTKNKHKHIVPLNELALSILDPLRGNSGDLVFTTTGETAVSGFSAAKRQLDRLLDSQPWRIHDLRRTVSTGMQALGVAQEVTEHLLNHRSGSQSGLVGVYQLHAYTTEKRQAVDSWNAYVGKAVGLAGVLGL